MSMGRRDEPKQGAIWVETAELARGEGHAFYTRLNEVLKRHGFDDFVEKRVLDSKVFAEGAGRPSVPPGVYTRMIFVGYFEGISSERGIAWKCADSLSLREFLGYGPTERTPDHSTLSVMRHRLPETFHREVFGWVLKVIAEEGLLKGRRVTIDATTLKANASMRSIVRRADGASYEKYLKKLAKAEGIKEPTPEDLAGMDRKRKGKKASNKEWRSPSDRDARITKMKDGTTRLAHKAEHVVDLDTGVIVAAEIHPADFGDTATLPDTLDRAETAVQKIDPEALIEEVVADRGYHSTELLGELREVGYRTCIPERKSTQNRRWKKLARRLGRRNARRLQHAVYANRRRVKSAAGRKLLRKRGETVERSFAHLYETGGMRRIYLRGHGNIRKRHQLHVAAANLGSIMRKLFGVGTPRSLQDLFHQLHAFASALLCRLRREFGLLAAARLSNLSCSQLSPRFAASLPSDTAHRFSTGS